MDAAASLERGIADAADTTALSLEKDSAAETATPYGASDTTVFSLEKDSAAETATPYGASDTTAFSLEKDSAADAAGATGVAAPSVAKDIASAPGKTVRNRIKSAISLRSFSPRVLPFKKAGAVGVDIGHDDLRMVLATKSDGKWKLPALKKTPIPRDLSRTSDGFIEFLRRELSSFVGAKSYNIWTVVSPSEIEIRNLRIPKVPKKQIEDVVFWSVKKEFPFDEKESILDFEVLGEVIDQGIPKISVMAYIAPKQGAETLQRLFSRAGYPLNGISITPFAIQNLFRSGWMGAAGETIACLHVGFDYSRIDIFAGGNLTMTRDIKTGTNSMVESFVDQYNDKVRQTFSGSAEEIDMDGARKVVYALSPDSPQLSESDKGYNLQQEDIFEMIMPALERLVRQVERTCDYYNGTLGYEKVVRIHISGAIDSSMKLVAYVGSQLGIAAAPLDPLGEQAPDYYRDGRSIAAISERMAYGPALGMALAVETVTPNLLFTYRDRETAASIKRINRNIFIGFLVIVGLCAGVFSYQQHVISGKKAVIAELDQQLGQFHPVISKELILEAAARSSQHGPSARAVRNRYLGMALISELSAMTAPNIQFVRLKLNLSPVSAGANSDPAADPAKKAPAPAIEESVEIEGLITGERSILETTLAGYAMALKSSPLFKQVVVQKNAIEPLKNGEALYFVISVKVG